MNNMKIIYYSKIFYLYYKSKIKSYIIRYKNRKIINQLENDLVKQKKYLAVLTVSSIGALSSQIDYYYKFASCHNLDINTSFYFIASNSKICNSFFLRKINKVITINFDNQLWDLLMTNGVLDRFVKKKYCIKFENDFVNFCPKVHFPIKFSKTEINRGNKIFKKLKILNHKNLVGISIKNNDYWKNIGINKPWDEYRHSSIKNIVSTFKYLKKNKYHPILLGDYNLDGKFKSFFSYSLDELSANERELFDIYVFSKIKFYIVGAIGLKFVAELFSVPMLSHNAFLPQWQSNGIFLPKKFVYKNSKKIIPLGKLIKSKLLGLDIDQGRISLVFNEPLIFRSMIEFSLKNIEIIENSSQEILVATKELIKLINKNDKYFKNKSYMQNQIKKFFFENVVLSNSVINYGVNYGGYFSPSFIEKNKNLLK